MTDFKPKGLKDTAKFIYAVIDNKSPLTPSYKGDIEFVKYGFPVKFIKLLKTSRICVPMNTEKRSFLDARCPLDNCEEQCIYFIYLLS